MSGVSPGEKPLDRASGKADLRLSRARRLRLGDDIRATFDRGFRSVGRFMVMWSRRDNVPAGRVGVVASKRTFARAVDRNRAKRLLREAYRLNRGDLASGHDIVLVGRRRILDASCSDVEEDLLKLAGKSGLLNRGGDAER